MEIVALVGVSGQMGWWHFDAWGPVAVSMSQRRRCLKTRGYGFPSGKSINSLQSLNAPPRSSVPMAATAPPSSPKQQGGNARNIYIYITPSAMKLIYAFHPAAQELVIY
jgi:hypothetical protein